MYVGRNKLMKHLCQTNPLSHVYFFLRVRYYTESYTVYFGYSGHLGPPLSGYCIRLATISDFNIIEYVYFVTGKVGTLSEWPL